MFSCPFIIDKTLFLLYILLVFKELKFGFAGKSMVESKNLKLKLGLCGLALTSFLAINAHSTVHADTVQDNANQNAITWDSDQDDSQVVKEESQQQVAPQSVQKQAKQSTVQASQSQPVQNKKVMVSDVSSVSVSQKRAETSNLRQSNAQTSTVSRLNADNHRAKTVKVSNIDSDAQAPVQTQVIAKLSPKAKTYAISIATTSNANEPVPYSGYSRYDGHTYYGYDGWIYNGQIYDREQQSALETALGGDIYSPSFRAKAEQVATINPQWITSGTEFLTDTGVTYNNQRVGLLIIPKFTELKTNEIYSDDPSYSGMLSQYNGYILPYTEGFLPALPITDMEWTGSELEPNKDENWHMTYSYTAVPIDMNTGKTISGISLDGTATKPCNLQTYTFNQTDQYGGDSYMTPFSETTITGSAISSDQNLVSPYIKLFLDGINSGKIQPYSSYNDFPGSRGGDYGSKWSMYNHYNTEDSELKGHGQNTTYHKFIDDTIVPYTENLLYLTLKTRQVNPDSPNAKKQAKRIIHLNFPNGVRPDSYNNIVDKDNNVVQTVTFTRSGTENLADGSVQWGPWQGDGKFAPVTLPGIPGYTMVTTN